MRLTDEVIKSHEYKTGLVVPEGCHLILASELKNFIDTIEALQLEIEQLSKQLDNRLKYVEEGNRCIEILTDKNEQLQAQDGVMRGALKQARKVLTSVSFRSGLGSDEDGIREAIVAIDKAIGGREDV